MRFPESVMTKFMGRESAQLCTFSNASGQSACTTGKFGEVQAISVDDFVERHVPGRHVYHVSIDVEGFDSLVVEGMRSILRDKRADVFEFEYKRKGYWNHPDPGELRSLAALVGWVGELGYECFWEAGAQLVPISGNCWRGAFGNVGWSNVLCTHVPALRAAFRSSKPVAVASWAGLLNERLRTVEATKLVGQLVGAVTRDIPASEDKSNPGVVAQFLRDMTRTLAASGELTPEATQVVDRLERCSSGSKPTGCLEYVQTLRNANAAGKG